MNKFKLAVLATCMVSGLGHAATSCDGFEIKVKNALADDLLVTSLRLQGAELQNKGFQKIDSKTEQVFTVNKSAENVPITGEFVFHTISLPVKTVKINFDLTSKGLICQHDDKSPASDYSVGKLRLPGKVDYTISNK